MEDFLFGDLGVEELEAVGELFALPDGLKEEKGGGQDGGEGDPEEKAGEASAGAGVANGHGWAPGGGGTKGAPGAAGFAGGAVGGPP